jgi:hypothetical protein
MLKKDTLKFDVKEGRKGKEEKESTDPFEKRQRGIDRGFKNIAL